MLPAIIDGLPQTVRDRIEEMYRDDRTYREIHGWLHVLGFDRVTVGMLSSWCRSRFGIREPVGYAEPAATSGDRLRQYVDAVLAANLRIYTLNRIGLRGPVWGPCTLALKRAGLVAPDNPKGSRYRLMVSFEELRGWVEDRSPTPQ